MWQGVENRRFPRVEYPCWVKLTKKGHPKEYFTHTENIGCGGVCVVLSKNLGIFQEIDLEIDLKDSLPFLKTRGRIVWAIKKEEIKAHKVKQFDTGIEFINLKAEDKKRIEAIIEKCSKNSPA